MTERLSGLLEPDFDFSGLVWVNPAKLARSAREGNMVDEPLTHPFIEAVQAMSENNYQSWLIELDRQVAQRLESEGMSVSAINRTTE